MNCLRRCGLSLGLLALSWLGAGCATTAPGATSQPSQALVNAAPTDPWERWNRKVFAFNEALDEAVLKPLAHAYRDAVPALVRAGIGNLLGNIGDLWSASNHLLQGKLHDGRLSGASRRRLYNRSFNHECQRQNIEVRPAN